MMTNNFRIIIVGGGPAGLTAAHALRLADIDFTVLEKRNTVVEDVGASLVLGPQSLRVMQQFGIFDALQAVGGEVKHSKSFTLDGYVFKDNTEFQVLNKNHGTAPVTFHRAQLIQIIYDCLPDSAKEKVLTGKKVIDITPGEDGVTVCCADGSTYQGSVVIGADGVHSKTRHLMRKLALEANPKASWDPEEPYTSSYKCMWCSFPRPSESGESYDTQHKDGSVMYLTGRDRGWIFLYKKLPQPTKQRAFYTDKDVEAFAEEFAEYPVNETLKVKDVFAQRLTAGMADLEEGVVQNWSLGRVVLVGDACHKFTPNAGLGFNNGIQDVVMLCNGLREAVVAAPGGQPASAVLTEVFEKYQTTRRKVLKNDASLSAYITRSQAWENMLYFVISRYLTAPRFVEYLFMEYVISSSIRQGLVLDYVSAEERVQGKVSWAHPMKASMEEAHI